MTYELISALTKHTIAAFESQDAALEELRRMHRLTPDEVEAHVALVAVGEDGIALEHLHGPRVLQESGLDG